MELVMADGKIAAFSRDAHPDKFPGMVVGLGGFGVVTKLTLEVLPTFTVRQDIYEYLPVKQLEKHFDQIMSTGYSVSLFTDWQTDTVNQVWVKSIVPGTNPPPDLFGATPASSDLHPIKSISAKNCTAQMGLPGPWHERLPHFRMDYTPSSGEELQSEYFVPREHGVAALRVVAALREQLRSELQISEVRSIAADQLWMSPCYDRDSIAIHFTWKQNWPAVRKLLGVIEEALSPFNARPHWGKNFTISPNRLQSLYKKLPEFRQLLLAHDPHGKFRNAFMETYIFGSGS
jgi:xylitol oxidase